MVLNSVFNFKCQFTCCLDVAAVDDWVLSELVSVVVVVVNVAVELLLSVVVSIINLKIFRLMVCDTIELMVGWCCLFAFTVAFDGWTMDDDVWKGDVTLKRFTLLFCITKWFKVMTAIIRIRFNTFLNCLFILKLSNVTSLLFYTIALLKRYEDYNCLRFMF